MPEQILVSFSASDGGVDDLSWGQSSIWDSMTNADSSLPIGDCTPVPPGMTVDAAAAVLRYIMCRHQSLRTRVVTGADGRLSQHVRTSGTVPLEIIDAGADDPADVAERTKKDYYARDFDYEHEWPIRMAVVRSNGAITHVVAVYCHIAVDVHGIDALVSDLVSMDPTTGGPTAPVPGLPPLAQAQQQRTPGARRHSDAAVRYTERLIRDVPARRYQDSDDPRLPRWWQIGFDSPAAYLAGLTVAARNRVHTTPVLLAAFAVAFSEVTCIHPAVAQLVVNNRFRPGLAMAVGPISEACVGVIEVADSTFDEVVGRAWQASTRAGKHSYYDPRDMADMLARVAAERGEEIDLDCYFNDRRRTHLNPPPLDNTPTPADLAAARAAGAVRWEDPMEHYDHTVFFHVNDVPDTFDLLMAADTHKLSPAGMETLMRRMEDVLVTAVLAPDVRIGSLSRKAASVEY
jgi:hypothetical protein